MSAFRSNTHNYSMLYGSDFYNILSLENPQIFTQNFASANTVGKNLVKKMISGTELFKKFPSYDAYSINFLKMHWEGWPFS